MKNISIVIDATGSNTYLYLLKENEILDNAEYENKNNLSYSLSFYIKQICESNNHTINDISSVYLVYGPGKFSAMRIAAIVSKTISLINNASLFILDKLTYLSTNNCYCIIESDGNKSFVAEFNNGNMLDSPRLIDNDFIPNFTTNKNIEIIKDNSNIDNVLNKLESFKKVNYNFELEYWKKPC